MTKRKFKSEAFAAIHEQAEALHRVGAMDKITMREIQSMAFAPVAEITPQKIRAVREANNVSQAVFARALNTSLSTVQKWETGAKAPGGMALKLLSVVDRNGLDVLRD